MFEDNLAVKIITNTFTMVVLAFLTLGLLVVAVLSMMGGAFPEAGEIGTVVTAMATILLVSVTLRYVRLTNDLVGATEEALDQEVELRREDDQKELDSLRRAFIREINTVQGFQEFGENYGMKASVFEFVTPSTVYEANAGQIGLLTEDEADAVVEFYTRVEQLEALLRMQKELDTPYGKDAIMRYFKSVSVFQEEVLRLVTGGKVTPEERYLRTEHISTQYKELEAARRQAVCCLSEQLEELDYNE